MPRSSSSPNSAINQGPPAAAAADTSTVTSVPASTSAVTLVAANPDRFAMFIYNNSSANLFVKFGAGASTTDFTAIVPSNTFFDLPPVVAYTGLVTGAWDAATGSAEVTEVD